MSDKATLTIDGKSFKVNPGTTVLQASTQNGIYIPSLCAHPELEPYGGCRLCLVEVEGMRGYPAACTTYAAEGMVVRTQGKALQSMRRDALQFILSEHPSSCLICEEGKECFKYQETVRKVGLTTGCRWCPRDGDCELQKVVDFLAVDEIAFPVSYRGFPLENKDPFYDRDYNLCIYCARCVRVCEEQRKSYVLTLKQRGRSTTVGPAFKWSHVEAGCEFCGACVSVCPTGALSEKSRKWWGVPEAYHPSSCPLCSLHCDLQVLTRDGKVVGTLPPGDPHLSGGELCVKGRFCLSELVNHPDRIQVPQYRFPEGGRGVVSWDQAIEKAREGLKAFEGNRVAFYLSPDLSVEEFGAATRFAERVIQTPYVTSSVLDRNLLSFVSLAEKSISLKDLESSSAIVSIFLNGNYNFAPLTLAVKRAAGRGVPFYQIGWLEDTTSRFAAHRLVPSQGHEGLLFQEILRACEGEGSYFKEITDLARDLKSRATLIVGPGILDLTKGPDILRTIENIIARTGCRVLAPYPFGNLAGLLSQAKPGPSDEVSQLIAEGKIDLLYVVGEVPFVKRPPVRFVIHQGAFPPPDDLLADLILPAAMWGETSGSYHAMKGHPNLSPSVVKPFGEVRPHQEIFAQIAKALDREAVSDMPSESEVSIPAWSSIMHSGAKPSQVVLGEASNPTTVYPYVLVQERTPHLFQGGVLSRLISGMQVLAPEDTLILNPADAALIGLSDGDSVGVETNQDGLKAFPVMLRRNIAPGFVYLATSGKGLSFSQNPCPVSLRRTSV